MVEYLLSMFKTLGSIFVSRKKIHSIKNKLNNKFVKSGLSGLCTWPMCTQDSLSKCSLVVPGLVAMWEFSLVYLSSCTLCFMYFLCVCPYITAFQSNEERIKSLSPYECFHCRKPGRYITHRSWWIARLSFLLRNTWKIIPPKTSWEPRTSLCKP